MDMWKAITGETLAYKFKTCFIQHPTLRIMHRVISCTIFARGETVTKISEPELEMFDMMLRESPQPVGLGIRMLMHWDQVRRLVATRNPITLGAYISHIAQAIDASRDRDRASTFEECQGINLIDIDYLTTAQFLRVQGQGMDRECQLNMEGRVPLDLPYFEPLVPNDPSTWLIPEEIAPRLPYYNHARQGADKNAGADADGNNPNAEEGAINNAGVDAGGNNIDAGGNNIDFNAQQGGAGPSSQAGPSHVSSTSATPYFPPRQWYTNMDTSVGNIIDSLGFLRRWSTSAREEIRELRRLSDDNNRRLTRLEEHNTRLDEDINALYHEQWRQNFFNAYGHYPDE